MGSFKIGFFFVEMIFDMIMRNIRKKISELLKGMSFLFDFEYQFHGPSG